MNPMKKYRLLKGRTIKVYTILANWRTVINDIWTAGLG